MQKPKHRVEENMHQQILVPSRIKKKCRQTLLDLWLRVRKRCRLINFKEKEYRRALDVEKSD